MGRIKIRDPFPEFIHIGRHEGTFHYQAQLSARDSRPVSSPRKAPAHELDSLVDVAGLRRIVVMILNVAYVASPMLQNYFPRKYHQFEKLPCGQPTSFSI